MQLITQPGLYDLSNADYHAQKDVISSSQIGTACEKSWAHFFLECEPSNPNRKIKESTKAMDDGTAQHLYLLEPEKFHDTWLVLPEGINLRTNDGKAVRDEYEARAAKVGGGVVKAEELENIIGMAKALERQEIELAGKSYVLKDLFNIGKPEESFFWTDPATGIMCRVRPDWRIPDLKVIISYKTTRNAQTGPFNAQAGSSYYWMREAMYLDGLRAVLKEEYQVVIVGQEKIEPWLGQAFCYQPHELEAAREVYLQKLRELAECRKTGVWPGYSKRLQELSIPKWALFKHREIQEVLTGEVAATRYEEQPPVVYGGDIFGGEQ